MLSSHIYAGLHMLLISSQLFFYVAGPSSQPSLPFHSRSNVICIHMLWILIAINARNSERAAFLV